MGTITGVNQSLHGLYELLRDERNLLDRGLQEVEAKTETVRRLNQEIEQHSKTKVDLERELLEVRVKCAAAMERRHILGTLLEEERKKQCALRMQLTSMEEEATFLRESQIELMCEQAHSIRMLAKQCLDAVLMGGPA